MKEFTKDTIEVELARIHANLKVLAAVSNELKRRPDGYGLKIGVTLAEFMDRISKILDDMVVDTEVSIRELYTLLNRK